MSERHPSRPRAMAVALVLVAAVGLLSFLVFGRAPRSESAASATGSPSASAAGATTSAGSSEPAVSPPTPSSTAQLEPVVLVGAGDIARCDLDSDDATAELLDGIEGTIFTLGDNVYDDGTPEEFASCYDPTWGRHLERTLFPAPGDHDWATEGAAGYLDYFGERAAPEGTTWYSRDIGAWHAVVLDVHCAIVEGCDQATQLGWLAADLAASDARCTLAITHYPRFSSGVHGSYEDLIPFWEVLYEAGADVVLSGDDHNYERFAPQDPDGEEDLERGIRQFVVGTGGTTLRDMERLRPNSEVTEDGTFGVLRLELRAADYDWAFVPVPGSPFTDDGTDECR